MKPLTSCLALLFLAATVAHGQEPPPGPPESTLVGRLALPEGSGSRGVEIITEIANGGDSRRVWLLFDEQGSFTHEFAGDLESFQVTAGIGRQVHRIDGGALPEPDDKNRIDVGLIDLRERLERHRLLLRAAEGKAEGVVRIGMFFGPPHRGPNGESVSLGSRQFPPVTLGSELEWLLPHGADSIYFLVERPDGPGRGLRWRSGDQRLFGPFTSAELPAELAIE